MAARPSQALLGGGGSRDRRRRRPEETFEDQTPNRRSLNPCACQVKIDSVKEQEPASVTLDSARRCPPEGTRARVPRGVRSLPVTRAVMSSSCSNGVVDLHAMLDPVSESSSFFPFGRFRLSARPVAASALIRCATCTPAGLAQIRAAKRRAQL